LSARLPLEFVGSARASFGLAARAASILEIIESVFGAKRIARVDGRDAESTTSKDGSSNKQLKGSEKINANTR